MLRALLWFGIALGLLAGCGGGGGGGGDRDTGPAEADAGAPDAGPPGDRDAGPTGERDAGPRLDDAGPPGSDAGPPDAGPPPVPRPIVVLSGGAGRATSPRYTLDLSVGAPAPTGVASGGGQRLRLGPGAPR